MDDDERIEKLERACRAADHCFASLLAVREGATDELLQEMRSAIADALDPNAPDSQDGRHHRLRHVELHRMLDELLADFFGHRRSATPSETPILTLMQWSQAETIEPTEFEKGG
jgi:hypothetical protein